MQIEETSGSNPHRAAWIEIDQERLRANYRTIVEALPAQTGFAAVVKDVKTHLKGPLSDKQPIYALNFQRIGRVADSLVVEDAKGERLVLTDAGMTEEPASCHLLSLLPRDCFADQTLVVRFRHDLDSRKLQVKPLSLVTPTGIVRLTL